MTLKTETKVDIYEVNGEEQKQLTLPTLSVNRHWNHREWVVVRIGGKSYTVNASELERAIANASD